MAPTDGSGEPAPVTAQAAGSARVTEDVSLRELAAHTGDYARAWGSLFLSEAALAKTNLFKLLLIALLVPAVALSSLLCLDAVLAALLHSLLQNWIYAILIVFVMNLLGLVAMYWLLRGWWRTLTLPRTRAALSRLMEGLQ
jgi:uncharacterized membrane protein YqjE